MKRKAFTISIPEPCSASWAEMTPVDKGRFCQQCSKTVIDFTNKSDAEVIRLMRQTTISPCGRFSSEQLQRPIYDLAQEKSRSPLRWIAGLLFWVNAERISAQVQDPPSELDSLSTKNLPLNPNATQNTTMIEDSSIKPLHAADSLEIDSLTAKIEVPVLESLEVLPEWIRYKPIEIITMGPPATSGFCELKPIKMTGILSFITVPEKLSKTSLSGKQKSDTGAQISNKKGNNHPQNYKVISKQQSIFLLVLKYILLITPIVLLLTYFKVRKQKN